MLLKSRKAKPRRTRLRSTDASVEESQGLLACIIHFVRAALATDVTPDIGRLGLRAKVSPPALRR